MRSVFARIFFIPAAVLAMTAAALYFLGIPLSGSLGAFLGALVLGALLSFKAAYEFVEPVRELMKKVRRFPQAVPAIHRKTVRREMNELAQTISELLERVKRQFHDLRLEKETLGALINHLSQGILCVDRYGTVVFASRSLDDRLVRPGAPGQPYFRTTADPDLLEFIRSRLAMKEIPAEMIDEEREIRISGSVFAISCAPVILEKEVEMLLFIFRDLTREKQTARLREEFLQNASHELKTPLTSIRGYAETIEQRITDDQLRGFTQAILRNVMRMDSLIDDMAMISSLESMSVRFVPEVIEIGPFLAEIGHLMQGTLQRKNQRLELESAGGSFTADRVLMEHLLLNLAANASRYSPPGTTVTARIDSTQRGSVTIELLDRGPGIPEEFRDKIFLRFFRIDPERDRTRGGTGLGLSIVRRITRLHGGEVEALERPGGGSIFRVLLPQSEPQPSKSV